MAAAVNPYLNPEPVNQRDQATDSAAEFVLNLATNVGSSLQRAILDELPALIFIEQAGQIVFANTEARQSLGQAGEWQPCPVEEVLWGLLPGTAEPKTNLQPSGRSRPFHATMPVAGGGMLPVEGAYAFLDSSRQEAVIVAHPGAAKPAPKSNFMEDVLASLPQAVAIEHDNHILYANPAFTRVFGYTADEIGGCSMSELMMNENSGTANSTLASLPAGDRGARIAASVRNKQGLAVNVCFEVSPLMVDGQNAGQVFTFHEAEKQDGVGSWQKVDGLENFWVTRVVPFP